MLDRLIAYDTVLLMLCLGLVSFLAFNVDLGCHVLGQEVNKNGEIEYLMIGNCQ